MTIDIEVPKGSNICNVIENAIQISKKEKVTVKFIFNDIDIKVQPTSNKHDILSIYSLKLRLSKYE